MNDRRIDADLLKACGTRWAPASVPLVVASFAPPVIDVAVTM